MLAALARRGIQLEILADASRRRVPDSAERRLRAAGVGFQRVRPPDNLPMHNKFALIESATERRVVFGSVNWTERSRWLSHEVAVISRDPDLYAAFAERWKVMQAQTAGNGPASPQRG
jgi:phosphatidylserine/phosphatidylglycerophosphate/cardiolipin synthase-like enzyme